MLGSNEVIRTDFFSPEECNQVKKYIDSKNFNTTKYFDRYNFFDDNPQYVDKFVLKLKDILHLDFPIAVQAWVNSYEKGQGIEPHNHHGLTGYSFACNIFISGNTQPGITYMEPGWEQTYENKLGELQLFNCGLFHTVGNHHDEKRYSVGITIHTREAITKELLDGACINSKYREIVLMSDLINI